MRRPRFLLTFVTASNLFSLFKISLENFFKVRFYVYKHLSIQPSELNEMEYYEYFYIVKDLIEDLKKENEANKGQQEAASGMTSGMKAPNIKVPSIKIPKM